MKKNVFFDQIKEALELDDKTVNEETTLNLSSLQILSVIAFVDEKFDKQIKVTDLKGIQTIKNLMTAIGTGNFED